MILMIGLAVLLGLREMHKIKKKMGHIYGSVTVEEMLNTQTNNQQQEKQYSNSKIFWFNIFLTISIIAVLVSGLLPAGLVFMIGLSIALPINYTSINDQKIGRASSR